jgi:hypothetical protein
MRALLYKAVEDLAEMPSQTANRRRAQHASLSASFLAAVQVIPGVFRIRAIGVIRGPFWSDKLATLAPLEIDDHLADRDSPPTN